MANKRNASIIVPFVWQFHRSSDRWQCRQLQQRPHQMIYSTYSPGASAVFSYWESSVLGAEAHDYLFQHSLSDAHQMPGEREITEDFHYYCADRAQIVARLPTMHRSITTLYMYMYFSSSQLLYEFSPLWPLSRTNSFLFLPTTNTFRKQNSAQEKLIAVILCVYVIVY